MLYASNSVLKKETEIIDALIVWMNRFSWKDQKEERVFVLPLDAHGKVLAKPILVSVGHADGTAAIDAGAIFREALKAGAEEIVVAHNHPSGDLTPSKADIAATKELKDLAARLGVVFLDHIILGSVDSVDGSRFVSLAEQGI